MQLRDEYLERLGGHYRAYFDTPEKLELDRGPTHQLPDGFHVLRFAPSRATQLFAFATCGMAIADGAVECFLLSPVADESQVELLTAIAWFHASGTRLAVGHTVNFGRAWLPDSGCTHGLLSLPYLHGPPLEWFRFGEHDAAQVLWLIPITKLERDFKAQHGLEALESRFESAAFDYANPRRSSVVTPDEVAPNV